MLTLACIEGSVGSLQRQLLNEGLKNPLTRINRYNVIDMAQTFTFDRPTVKRFVTRLEASKILKMTVKGVQRLEQRGHLHGVPVKDAHGFVRPVGPGQHPKTVLRLEDVERVRDLENLKRVGAGDLASEAWKLFRSGASVVDVVINLRIVPERAEELFTRYKANVGGLTVPSTVIAAMVAMGFEVNADNFVEVIERLLRTARSRLPVAQGR